MPAKLFSRYAGTERVGGGIYWSRHDGGFVSVPQEGGELPGQLPDAFTRVPILVVLVAAPILGTAFALFLPAAAFLGVFRLLLEGLSRSKARAGVRGEASAEYLGVSLDTGADLSS
jgi:hypothetical protein